MEMILIQRTMTKFFLKLIQSRMLASTRAVVKNVFEEPRSANVKFNSSMSFQHLFSPLSKLYINAQELRRTIVILYVLGKYRKKQATMNSNVKLYF